MSQDRPRITSHRMCELQIANPDAHVGKYDEIQITSSESVENVWCVALMELASKDRSIVQPSMFVNGKGPLTIYILVSNHYVCLVSTL